MKVLSITPFYGKTNIFNLKTTSFKAQNQDTFIKTGVQESSDNIDIEKLKLNPKEMLKLYQSATADKNNKIGSGFTHSVYKIPNVEGYVFRVPTDNLNKSMDFMTARYKESSEAKDLDVNVGQKVGELKFITEDNHSVTVELRQFAKGISLGIPPIQAVRNKEEYNSMENKEYYAKTIAQTASLPLEAYEKLISDFQKVYKAGYHFDHLNSNNLLIDEKNKSINLIDLDKLKMKPNYGNLLYALTNIGYFETYTSAYDSNPVSDEKKNEVTFNTMQIIDKFTKAMQKQNVKFKMDEISYEFMKFLTSLPCYCFCQTTDFNTIWVKFEQMGITG